MQRKATEPSDCDSPAAGEPFAHALLRITIALAQTQLPRVPSDKLDVRDAVPLDDAAKGLLQ